MVGNSSVPTLFRVGGHPLSELFFGDDHAAANVQHEEPMFVREFVDAGR